MTSNMIMTAEPFFHAESQEVRFYVPIDGEAVAASIGQATLHYYFRSTASENDPLQTFKSHTTEIEAAVRRRVSAGSYRPVMLREHDLRT